MGKGKHKRKPQQHDDWKNRYRINREIDAKEVRLVGDNIPKPGIYPIEEALRLARSMELDLVEVAPHADPPVCRIMDFNKFIYEKKKKERELKKKATRSETKEIRFTPQTDEHDLQFKLRYARSFLEEGHKVRMYVMFRGRQIIFKEQGKTLLDRVRHELEDIAFVEQEPHMEGNRYVMILAPARKRKKTTTSSSENTGATPTSAPPSEE